jgi:hypothetical protein
LLKKVSGLEGIKCVVGIKFRKREKLLEKRKNPNSGCHKYHFKTKRF